MINKHNPDYLEEEDWICPYCNKESTFIIIEECILKNILKEILLECTSCKEYHIRQYKHHIDIKLNRGIF